MHSLKLAFAKYSASLLGLLAYLGIWGPFVLSLADSGAFGVPMDPVMIGYAWKDRDHLWLVAFYCVTAAIASALGSLIPYVIGRAGGELVLLKRIDRHRLERMRDRFEKQEFIFIMIPAMLPPPTPFKLFVLSAGVFEMRVTLFMLSVFLGRIVRFGLSAFLAVQYGPDIVRITMDTARHHLLAALSVVALCVSVLYVWRRLRRRKAVAEI